LATVGDLVLDIVVAAGAQVDTGTDVPGTIRFRAGGSAANTARVFAGLGGEGAFIGAVGDDIWGRRLLAALRADGVRVRAVTVTGATARLVAIIGPGGERSFVTERAAADMLRPEDIKSSWVARLDLLHLPAYSLLREPLAAAAVHAARQAREGGAIVSVDLASRRPLLEDGADAAFGRIRAVEPDILFANVEEAVALAGTPRSRRLLRLAPVVVIKEGQAGCHLMWRPTSRSDVLEMNVATKPAAAADTTGAGDAFDAGFLHHLAAASDGPPAARTAQDLRRAAVAGHRAATRLLTRPRPQLAL
jgi:sugar/nucleoside kinase (ribokinase family)